MALFLASVLVFGLSFLAMALGVLLGRDRASVGCARCEVCERPCRRRQATR